MGAEGRPDTAFPAGPPSGFSLPEVLVCLAILALLIGMSLPLLADTVARERLQAAGLETAMLLRGLRQRSVAEQVGLGLRFVPQGTGWSYSVYRDGNANGIRTAEILSGRDPCLAGPEDPGTRHEGIRFGLPRAAIPQIPPNPGLITNPTDPIKFGGSDLIGFSPSGSISSGTLYLTDGRRVVGVVVYGPTGRIRVFRFEPDEGWRSGS